MSDQLPAEVVARKDFPLSFRGFDQQEVRAHLERLAREIEGLRAREADLLGRIAALEDEATREPDEAMLEKALGQEATRVLHVAREGAAAIRAKAEEDAAAARAEAASMVDASRDDAEQRAAKIVDEARARADAMLADATAGRDRVLADIDRLRVARDRLAASFEEVRRALEIGEAVPSPLALDDAPAPSVIEPAVVGRVDAEPADEATVVEAEPVAALPVAAVPAEPEPEPAEPAPEWEPEPEPADVDPMDDHPDAGVEVDSPPPVARGGRGSTVRLVPPAGGTPVAPPADDDFEGVRIIEPEPVADDVEPVADDAEPAADADEEGEPVDGLFTRLRAERAAKVADAEAVLAERAPDPAGDHEDLAPAESAAPEEPAATETDGLEPDLAVLAARDEAIAAVDRGLVRALKRALADEQNEVLDALRRLRGRPGVEALLPDAARHRARFAAVLGDGAAAAAAAGGDVAGGAAVANEMGGSIAADLRSRVTRSVDDAGSDVETLAEAVSAIYREWKTAKAEPLARDVVNAGYAAGTYAASAGPVRWVVDPAEGGCPDCDDNALAGPTGKGQAFPTGQLHPPAHDGCRCLAVPAT